MNYRKKLYATYVSNLTLYLYGEANLNRIKRQFPVWKKYYGKFLPRDMRAKILDVGCGNGGFVFWLQHRDYINTKGIDISSEQIKIAENLGIKNVEQADIIQFLEAKRNFYDIIFARDVIEHFKKEEILDVLELINKSLKPHGTLVIQTVNCASPFAGRYRYGDFSHEIAFTKSSLYQILRAVGFKKVEFYPTDPVAHGIKSAIRFVLWRMILAAIRFYMLVETGSGKGIYTQNIIAYARK